MRLRKPRINPVPEAEWTDAQRETLAPYVAERRLYNIFTTLAHNPPALRAFSKWGAYVLRRSHLPERERELVILRVGFLCRSGYEWAQHVRIGKRAGLNDAEIARIKQGPDAADWSTQDRALLCAADELHHDQFISTATWQELGTFLNDLQRMDVVMAVGQYTQVSMMLNTFGVQLDDDLTGDRDLEKME